MSDIQAQLIDLIGLDATVQLIEHFGGTQLYIPHGSRVGELRLAQLLGAQAEIALAKEFGGTTLKVPLCKAWRARLYRARGMTHREIARRLGCTERGVVAYLKPENPAQQMALPL